MLCSHKQLCNNCKSFDILLHIMKSTRMDLSSMPQVRLHPQPHPYPYPHLYPHPLHGLLASPTAWPAPKVPSTVSPCHGLILEGANLMVKSKCCFGTPELSFSSQQSRGNRILFPINHSKNCYTNT